MISVKESVRFKSLRPCIYSTFILLDRFFLNLGAQCVITSANDSKHKSNSKHYSDEAIDIRSKHLPSEVNKTQVIDKLRDLLGNGYDIILEAEGTPNEHIHCEFDPHD